MKTRSTKTWVAVGALLQLSVMTAALADVCTSDDTGNSLGTVFSVIGDGVVNLKEGTATDQCNQLFYGTTTVGTKNGNLKQSGAGTKACQAYASQADLAAGKSTAIAASGSSASARTLDTYYESTSLFDLKFPTSGQISYGNNGSTTTNANGDEDFTLTADGRTVVVNRKTVNGNVTYTVPGGDYDQVAVDNGVSIVFSGPVKIKNFHMAACNSYGAGKGVTFSVGANYINTFDWSAGCDLAVSGTTGTATLNILGKANLSDADPKLVAATPPQTGMVEDATGLFIPSKSCINYSPCDPSQSKTWANMDAQTPERLQINVYHGRVQTQDSYSLAAGVYVDKGSYVMGNGTPVTVVGEILALNVETQNNTGSQFFSKATSMTTPGTNKSAGWVYSSYSMAMPVVASTDLSRPSIITIDCLAETPNALAYVATQRDGVSRLVDGKVTNIGNQVSGSLVAYIVDKYGRFSSIKWDAASILTTIMDGGSVSGKTKAWRETVMYSHSGSGHDVAPVKTLYGATLAQYLLDPTNAQRNLLEKKDTNGKGGAVFGRTWRTSPIVVGASVLFATEDGFLYSINRLTGLLNWGWIPKDLAALADPTSPDALMTRHPWGQLGSVVADDGKTYVTGSALGGAVHFSLLVNDAADELQKVAFYDYRAGGASPGGSATDLTQGDPVTGWPFGGAAPVTQAVSGSSSKVAYIVNDKLIVRNVDGSGTTSEASLTALGSDKATSNLIYWQDGLLYVGSKNGKVYEFNESGSKLTQAANADSVDLQLPSGEIVMGINGMPIGGGSTDAKTLVAQSKTQVSVLSFDNNDSAVGAWSFAWYTKAGGAKSSTSTVTVPGMPSGIEVTGLPALIAGSSCSGNSMLIPYTKDETDSALCLKASDAKTKGAYSFGPLALTNGNSSFLDGKCARQNLLAEDARDLTNLSVRTGDGYAYGIQVLHYEYGSSCGDRAGDGMMGFESTASGNPKTNFDAGTLPSGGNVTKDGKSVNESQPQGHDTHFSLGSSKSRVNWRELTNFF